MITGSHQPSIEPLWLTSVRRSQVDPHTSRSSGQKEDEIVRIGRIEGIHRLLSLSLLYVPIEPEKLVSLAIQEVLD